MTTANTQVIARVAAAVAGLGLVAMSFAPLAQAQTMTTTTATTTTTASATFARDLTLGSTGTDVTALQTWLISKGFSIPAGATGYFGAQTKAALGAYQASAGITPAAGYFGPITRAKLNAGGSTTTTTGLPAGCTSTAGFSSTTGKSCASTTTTTTTSTTLSGGEANLTDFDLSSEESEGNEGEEGVEIATVEFDVEDGDAEVQRVDFTFDASSASLEDQPWQFFDTLYIVVDGDEVAEVDASDRDEWDETTDDVYEITFTGLNYVVKEDDMASMVLVADMTSNIDTADLAQDFAIEIADDGVRAVDSEGVQQYTGDDTDTITFGFGEEENGDLSIRESDEDPDAANLKVEADETSEEFTVFAFDIRNTDDVDTLLTELTIDTVISGATTTSRVIRNATLVVDGDEYDGDIEAADNGNIVFEDLDVELGGDTTTAFELNVEFAAQSGNYNSNDTVVFDVTNADIEAEGLESGDSVETTEITGSATSETHTLALTGFMVEPSSTSQSVTTTDPIGSSVGTYTIKFDVTADEDNAIFVDDTAAVSASTTAGAVFNILGDTYSGTTTASLTSTADMTSGVYRVDAGDTETFTLTVTLNPTTAGQFRIELDQVHYGTAVGVAAYAQTFDVSNDNSDFETDNAYIPS